MKANLRLCLPLETFSFNGRSFSTVISGFVIAGDCIDNINN